MAPTSLVVSGLLMLTLLPSLVPAQTETSENYFIVTNYDTVSVRNMRGEVQHEFQETFCNGLAFDPTTAKIFWTNNDQGTIETAFLSGYPRTVLRQEPGTNPVGLAVDHILQLVFYSDFDRGLIGVMDPDGGSHRIVRDQGLGYPYALALDVIHEVLYYNENFNPGKIGRMNYNGSGHEVLIESSVSIAHGLALDVRGGRMYWTYNEGILESARLDGTDRTLLLRDLRGQFALAFFDGVLYLSVGSVSSIYSVTVNGTAIQELPTNGAGTIYVIAVYSESQAITPEEKRAALVLPVPETTSQPITPFPSSTSDVASVTTSSASTTSSSTTASPVAANQSTVSANPSSTSNPSPTTEVDSFYTGSSDTMTSPTPYVSHSTVTTESGTRAICPEGQCSETGYTPCDVCPSNITLQPNVTVSTETASVDSTQIGTIVFSCNFQTEAVNASQYLYDVFWYVSNVPVVNFTDVAAAGLDQTKLREEHWKNFSLGVTVNCSARVKFSYSTASSRHFYSTGFYAGLELDRTSLTVREGERAVLRVRSTVPVPYYLGQGGEKLGGLVVSVKSDATSGTGPTCSSTSRGNVGLPSNPACGVRLHISNYTAWVTISVWGTVDNLYTWNRFAILKISAGEATRVVPGRKLWANHSPPDVHVTIQDQDSQLFGRICQSLDDPHMTTLDGNWWENQREGEFILYKHNTLPLAVHTKYKNLWSWGPWAPTLNCAVAIRAFSSLLVLDRCSSSTVGYFDYPINYVNFIDCGAGHLTISRSHYTFKVTLPTGTAVQFDVYPFYAPGIGSVSVFPSVADLNNTGGLCGLLDGDPNNDFTLRDGTVLSLSNEEAFANNWRASQAESLFVTSPVLSGGESGDKFCICDSGESTCGLVYPAKRCPQVKSNSLNAFLQFCPSSRKRRDIRPSDLVSDGPSGWQSYGQEAGVLDRERRNAAESTTMAPEWTGEWNETTARAHCQKAFQDSAGVRLLESATGLSTTKERHIEGCIKDIQLSGGTNFTDVTVEVFKETALEAVQRDDTLKNSSSGATILQNIQANSCPKDCSGRGVCSSGTCQCSPGYVGQDCGIDRSTPPQNPYIPQNGLCDTQNRTCQSTPILADNLPDDGQVFCRFQRILVNGSRVGEVNWRQTTQGQPWLPGEVQCPFPSHRSKRQTSGDVTSVGYYVSISNDNVTFSTDVTVIIYDSRCFSCHSSNLTCLPTGQCASSSTPSETGGGLTALIVIVVSIVGGLVFLMVLALVGVLVYKKVCRRRTPVGHLTLPDATPSVPPASFKLSREGWKE